MNTIFFRTKGSQPQGWGNVMRQIIIAKKLEKDFKIFFFVEGDKDLHLYIKKNYPKAIFFKNRIGLNIEKEILKSYPIPDYSIIEMLYPNLKLQSLYKSITKKKTIVYDDILMGKYISDFLISCQKTKRKPKLFSKVKFLNDYSFYPVSDNVLKIKSKKKYIKRKINTVSVILGGSFYDLTYYKILNCLLNFNFKKIRFVISNKKFFQTQKKLKKMCKNIEVLKNVKNPENILFKSDLAIVGGGYTKIEAALVNTPFIPIQTHNHQKELITSFMKKLKITRKFKNNKFDLKKKIIFLQNLDNRKNFIKKLECFKPNGIKKLKEILN